MEPCSPRRSKVAGALLLAAVAILLVPKGGEAYVSIDKIIVPDIVFEEWDTPPIVTSMLFTGYKAPPITNSSSNGAKFDCVYRYDKLGDQNLVVKWYYEDDPEPIYQWIPELGKRFVSAKFRSHILINNNSSSSNNNNNNNSELAMDTPLGATAQMDVGHDRQSGGTQDEPMFRGFTLTRPTKELSGKYTCSVMSALNDDSKSKKMMVYALPKMFSFSAIKHQRDSGALQQQHQSQPPTMAPNIGRLYQHQQWPEPVPIPYRLRQPMMSSTPGQNQAQTMPPMTFANQMPQQTKHQTQQQLQEYLQRLQTTGRVPTPRPTPWPGTGQSMPANNGNFGSSSNGARLVCDIDQVYPMPEVSIYRLGKANGAHPEPSLLKLDTRVEKVRSKSSLSSSPTAFHLGTQQIGSAYHVQVTSFIDDDELIARYGQGPSNFECLITLPNLESTRYDSKRTIVYTPGSTSSSSGNFSIRQHSDTTTSDSTSSSMMTANGSWPFSSPPLLSQIFILTAITTITIQFYIFTHYRHR